MAERKAQARIAVTIRFPGDLYKRLDGLREQTGVPVQRVVIAAVREYLTKRRP